MIELDAQWQQWKVFISLSSIHECTGCDFALICFLINFLSSFIFFDIYFLSFFSVQNSTNFRASSALLASLTDYQYTLRSWKKDVYDLFLESDFFKMDHVSLRFWRYIIDHLMTYDSATFRDLMTRINMSQSGAINIFANREQEIEQRASLLKRLAFIIFCGETDQYHNYMPDVQERLVDSLRQMQVKLTYWQPGFCSRLLCVVVYFQLFRSYKFAQLVV